GARHVRSLARALHEEVVDRAAVIFVIQRPDPNIFSPNDPTDPKFGIELRNGYDQGVEIYALRTEVVNWNLELRGRIPIDLEYYSTER
ncbi:MAG: DNA/RNA nuclease SfsA, partial [Candidatus Thorarchaeota archaeon]